MPASVAAVVASIWLSGNTCPACHDEESLILVDQDHKPAESVTRTVLCNKCGKEWKMVYRIESISLNGVPL